MVVIPAVLLQRNVDTMPRSSLASHGMAEKDHTKTFYVMLLLFAMVATQTIADY